MSAETTNTTSDGDDEGEYLVDTATASEGTVLQLSKCPACETAFFRDGDGRQRIFDERAGDLNRETIAILIAHHISTHDPADFGITGARYKAGENIGAEPDLREVVV